MMLWRLRLLGYWRGLGKLGYTAKRDGSGNPDKMAHPARIGGMGRLFKTDRLGMSYLFYLLIPSLRGATWTIHFIVLERFDNNGLLPLVCLDSIISNVCRYYI